METPRQVGAGYYEGGEDDLDIREAYPLMDEVARREGWDDPEMDSHDIPRRHRSTAVNEAYILAQRAMADLKAAVYLLLKSGPKEGLRNADVGRALGIYAGHVGHEGHIPRTLLSLMESEGVVEQDSKTKLWTIRTHEASSGDDLA